MGTLLVFGRYEYKSPLTFPASEEGVGGTVPGGRALSKLLEAVEEESTGGGNISRWSSECLVGCLVVGIDAGGACRGVSLDMGKKSPKNEKLGDISILKF